jgi:hypothetical protein
MSIRIRVGANSVNLDLSGQTIGDIRNDEATAQVLGIESGYQATVASGDAASRNVSDDYVLQDGDNVEFVKPAGEKG